MLNIVLILPSKSLIIGMKAFIVTTVSFKTKKKSHLQVFYTIIYCKKTDVSTVFVLSKIEII